MTSRSARTSARSSGYLRSTKPWTRYARSIRYGRNRWVAPQEPLILSDFLSAYQRRRNPYYTEVLRPYQIEHQLKLFLPAPRGTSRGFTFDRGPGRDFGKRDRDLLTLLRPHLTRLRQRWHESFRSDCLTARENTIIRLVATGLTNRQIAAHLIISPGTVRTHLDHIYRKLDVHTRSAAVAATT